MVGSEIDTAVTFAMFKIIASVTVPIRTKSFARDRFACVLVEPSLRGHVVDAISLSFPCPFSADRQADVEDGLRCCEDIAVVRVYGEGGVAATTTSRDLGRGGDISMNGCKVDNAHGCIVEVGC